jgi:hypothetical protein
MFKSNSSKVVIMSVFFTALISILINQTAAANDYPSPPPVPSKFENPEEVQKYLKLLHNYYLIVGRPRFVFYCTNSCNCKSLNLIFFKIR